MKMNLKKDEDETEKSAPATSISVSTQGTNITQAMHGIANIPGKKRRAVM